jgi:hypothetical protein
MLHPSRIAASTEIRDAEAFLKHDGSLRIETAQFNATIYALESDKEAARDKAVRVAQELRGANGLAQSIGRESSLGTVREERAAC